VSLAIQLNDNSLIYKVDRVYRLSMEKEGEAEEEEIHM
jgi:hypothetical protein